MSHVLFPRALSRVLYRKCREAFPNEEYAILLGTKGKDGFEIEDLYFPPQRLLDMRPDRVNTKMSWFNDALNLAQLEGLEIIGEIHSHCYDVETEGYPGLDPSEDDWDRGAALRHITGGQFALMGIVRVLRKAGKLSCRSRFWPAVDLPVTIK
jgi:hypothetical protein